MHDERDISAQPVMYSPWSIADESGFMIVGDMG
jgi:hypothetical protein